jgi:hypothetical protein
MTSDRFKSSLASSSDDGAKQQQEDVLWRLRPEILEALERASPGDDIRSQLQDLQSILDFDV